jgi:anti-anti-sigma factor
MFEIEFCDDERVRLKGRLDASQVDRAGEVLGTINSSCTLDFSELSYISSAGLGLLFATQKRLVDKGDELCLVDLNPHIRELFQLAGFDHIFKIS